MTDDNTRRLDDIVKVTKARKDVGINFMKSWERERELQERCMAEGMEKGMAEGRQEGKLELLEELLSDGTITSETADKIREKLSKS